MVFVLVFIVFSMLHTSYRHTVYFGFVRKSAKTENGCVTEMGLLGKIDHNSKLVKPKKRQTIYLMWATCCCSNEERAKLVRRINACQLIDCGPIWVCAN